MDDYKAKVAELHRLRKEVAKLAKAEKALSDDLRVALLCGINVPGARLSKVKSNPKWATNALATAIEISPELTQSTLVDIKSISGGLLEECKRHGIVEYKTATPSVILDKPSLLDTGE